MVKGTAEPLKGCGLWGSCNHSWSLGKVLKVVRFEEKIKKGILLDLEEGDFVVPAELVECFIMHQLLYQALNTDLK